MMTILHSQHVVYLGKETKRDVNISLYGGYSQTLNDKYQQTDRGKGKDGYSCAY
jgi:uncharacterized protein YwgA